MSGDQMDLPAGLIKQGAYMDIYQQYLKYILDAGEGATVIGFIEEWHPVGNKILNEMKSNNLITVDENDRIHLTDIGKVAISV